jgi:hypothetical protein
MPGNQNEMVASAAEDLVGDAESVGIRVLRRPYRLEEDIPDRKPTPRAAVGSLVRVPGAARRIDP